MVNVMMAVCYNVLPGWRDYKSALCVLIKVLQSPQQRTIVKPPQVTLTTTPMVTLRGQPHSHIVVGQPQVQLQTGECIHSSGWSLSVFNGIIIK